MKRVFYDSVQLGIQIVVDPMENSRAEINTGEDNGLHEHISSVGVKGVTYLTDVPNVMECSFVDV